ncbi:MAG TPA: type II toxin-antitoxin system VapC family toxin [Phenylobacterium sp.]|nr:type II toxin-antitoxin system VapC family toxin [Phenylobacterium sp.]
MPAEWVLDASVAVKCFITEPGSEAARQLVGSGVRIVAPEFVFAEIASVATKRARRGDIERAFAEEIVSSAPDLFDVTYPVGPLAQRAQQLSFDYAVSVYDGLYVALAESLEIAVMTADLRLERRLEGSAISARIQILEID